MKKEVMILAGAIAGFAAVFSYTRKRLKLNSPVTYGKAGNLLVIMPQGNA